MISQSPLMIVVFSSSSPAASYLLGYRWFHDDSTVLSSTISSGSKLRKVQKNQQRTHQKKVHSQHQVDEKTLPLNNQPYIKQEEIRKSQRWKTTFTEIRRKGLADKSFVSKARCFHQASFYPCTFHIILITSVSELFSVLDAIRCCGLFLGIWNSKVHATELHPWCDKVELNLSTFWGSWTNLPFNQVIISVLSIWNRRIQTGFPIFDRYWAQAAIFYWFG